MPFAKLSGGRFHHQSVGVGHPFVFQHGLGGDVRQPLALADGLTGWRTLAMDCRGHGRTTASLDPAGLSFGQFADDLASMLDRWSVGRAVVGGISMGAGVALAFALSHPERVAGLVLVRPAWLDRPFPENLRWFSLAARLLGAHPAGEAARRFQGSPEFAPLAAESRPAADSLLAQFHRPRARARAAVLAAMPASVPVPDLAVCGQLKVPTLVVVNGQDPVHPAALGETLAAAIPGAALRRITPKAESETRHQADLRRAVSRFLHPLSALLTPDPMTTPPNLSAVWQSPGIAALEERPVRPPGKGEVRLRVLACGLCGTDTHIVQGEFVGAAPGVVLGHEACAEVTAVGPGVRTLEVGTRVAVDPNLPCGTCACCLEGRTHLCLNLTGLGSHADGLIARSATVLERLCVPVPDGLPDEVAALADPLACVLHAFDRSGLRAGENVLVVGAGPIGLMAAALARLHGASSVVVREANPARVERARALGFEADVPGEADANTADVVFECAGAAAAVTHAVAAARRGGRVVWVGVTTPHAEVPIRPFEVFRRELTLIGTFTNPFTTRRAVQVLAADPTRWRPFVTHTFPLARFAEAWDVHLAGTGLKVCVRPND